MRVYCTPVIWRFKAISSAGFRVPSHLTRGLRLRNYRVVAKIH